MMSVHRTTPATMHPRILAIVDAARVAEVEFCEWWVAPPPHDGAVFGHIQVAHRRAVSRVIEALLDLEATIDVDVGPSTDDARGRWSVWVRAHPSHGKTEQRQ